MKLYQKQALTPQRLLHYASENKREYGEKFQKFSQIVHSKFNWLIEIDFKSKQDKGALPLAVFCALYYIKVMRIFKDEYTRKQFLEDIRYKSKEIIAKSLNKVTESTLQKFSSLMALAINDPVRLWGLDKDKGTSYVYDLMNMAAQMKQSKYGEVEHYKEEEMGKISKVFKESVYLINYDNDKESLETLPLHHDSIYVLKAKKMYFLLMKDQDFSVLEKGIITHEELADIFKIEKSKLEQTAQKKVEVSPPKPKSEITQPEVSPRKAQSSLSVSRIKYSVLFPDDVSCFKCCKKVSEFNVLFWNYSYFCFECVLNPKIDISFIPSSIIEKFLKNQKYDSKQYLVICPQCKSETKIRDYRAVSKPKNYRCGACQKKICVQHEKLINQCFCECQKCRKATLSISSLFLKCCLSCKIRFCQICNHKGMENCACLCKICGKNKLIEHQCHERCHSCHASDLPFINCLCDGKLCSMCYFSSLEPNSSICKRSS